MNFGTYVDTNIGACAISLALLRSISSPQAQNVHSEKKKGNFMTKREALHYPHLMKRVNALRRVVSKPHASKYTFVPHIDRARHRLLSTCVARAPHGNLHSAENNDIVQQQQRRLAHGTVNVRRKFRRHR